MPSGRTSGWRWRSCSGSCCSGSAPARRASAMCSRTPSTSARNGTSISSLQHKVDKQPQDATAWRDLATAYEQKQRTADAVSALERYSALRPKDQNGARRARLPVLDAVADLRDRLPDRAERRASRLAGVCVRAGLVDRLREDLQRPERPAGPDRGGDLGPGADRRPRRRWRTTRAHRQNAEAALQKLAKLTPRDVTVQYQLGQAAQQAGDYKAAVAAYQRFLKLSPNDVDAPQVKQLLKQAQGLAASSAASASSG